MEDVERSEGLVRMSLLSGRDDHGRIELLLPLRYGQATLTVGHKSNATRDRSAQNVQRLAELCV